MTISRALRLGLALSSITILLPLGLLAQTKIQPAVNEVRVPFVGCASDGQAGPFVAPEGSDKVVRIDPRLVPQLAYYKAEYGPGVLAPAGWHCFGTYGSGGGELIVSPNAYKPSDFFSDQWKGIGGPAVEVSMTVGGTSGRFKVAEIIARVFPAHMDFARKVIDEGIEPASDFPTGPFPGDSLKYFGDGVVEFRTPPNSQGLGTMDSLKANEYPIDGVAVLTDETPDLVVLDVRLPPGMAALERSIIQQIELEYPVNDTKK